MPSLQQTSFKDWPSPDIARSLTGPDILQKHSINSLLLEHNEIISRGLPSPIEESVCFSELLGSSQSSQSTSTSSLLGTSGGHHGGHLHQHKYGGSGSVGSGGSGTGTSGGSLCPDSAASSILGSTGAGSGPNSASSPSVLSSSTNPFCFTGLSMSSSSLSSPELGPGGGGGSNGGGGQSPTYYGSSGTGGLHKSSFDDFRFDSDLGLSSNSSNNGSSNLTSETLKLLQRNSYQDCSPLPTSPSSSSSTTAALCARYFRGSQQQHQQQHHHHQIGDLNHNGYEPSSSSSLFSNTTAATANQSSSSSLSRSNSPPDHDASLLTNFDSTNILDMISYLTISQHQQQQHYSSSSNGGSSHYGQSSTSSSSLNSFYQHQQQQQGGSSYGSGNGIGQGSSIGGGCGGFSTNDYERLQNLQALNTLRLLQQSQYQLQQQYQQQFNQLMPSYASSQLKNWPSQNSPPSSTSSSGSCNGGGSGGGGGGGSSSGGNDINLDRIARFHRSSAAHYDATCTWSGVLPPRSHRLVTYSSKIFLGGMPWDISEQSLVQIFKPFGSIKVEWPGKEQQATQPKGYVYIIFESDKQVKALLQACTYSDANGYGGSSSRGGGGNGSGMMSSSCGSDDMQLVPLSPGQQQQQLISMANARINFKISSKRIKSKDVEVIPWNIADSNYVKSTSQKLDPTKTVFVGALHGQLTAEGLAKIMNDLFDGVVYVGIDTDKYKYPLGSARVTFNNSRSYMKAVVAAFIEIKTAKFTKKLQVDPYLEDSLCSMCGVQHGPYFCREIVCFRYFCRSCWQFQHNRDVSLQNHKPLTRNSKSTTIVGVGPQQSSPQQQQSPPSSMDSNGALHRRQQQLLYHHHMSQQQQQQPQQSSPTSEVHRRLYNVGHLQDLSSSSSLSLPQSPSPSCTTSSSGSSADSSPVNCHGPANLHQQLQQQFGAGGL